MLLFNAAYYADSEIDIPNNNVPLLVTSAGQSKIETLPKFVTSRPNGRRDFQIIYVKNGALHYTVDGIEHIAPRKSILLYHPFEPQFYTFYLSDSTDIYWIHFTGNQAEKLLKELDLFDKMCYPLSSDIKFEQFVINAITELKNKSPYYSNLCTTALQSMLFHVARNKIKESTYFNTNKQVVDEIIRIFNTNYNQQFNIGDIANQYNFSPRWLTILFKKHTNISPQQYLTQVRMEKAKLLLRTAENINDVAVAVGYNDPLYFSRQFRKLNGISPSEYRKNNKSVTPSSFDELPWYKNGFEEK